MNRCRMPDLQLAGCRREPLLSYLKALGILRLVAEDSARGDPEARGRWEDETFVLRSRFDKGGLANFFLNDYRPTPIVVPWSGSDFFEVAGATSRTGLKKAPTSSKIIESFLATKSERLASYREVIVLTLQIMKDQGVLKKAQIEGPKGKRLKGNLLSILRSRLPAAASAWVDTAATIHDMEPTFNALLGSGGGNDGNTHYSDNFMQSLWDCLPDFDPERKVERNPEHLDNALTGRPTQDLPDRTASLFDSGAVAAPNATAGFKGESYLNPWNFVLGLEGTLYFAGAVTRKTAISGGMAAFPFAVSLSAAGYGTAVPQEENQTEIWFPVWSRFAGYGELRTIFAEGRAQLGARAARTGTDFARAVASFGVDAGIAAFTRFAFVKGRVGPDGNTAACLGRVEVGEQRSADLLLEVDAWLEAFRRATVRDDKAPPRFGEAHRRIDRAILAYCRYGGASRMREILCSLGNAERELANGPKFRKDHQIRPIGPLSPAWVEACNDGSVEYRLAASLASVRGDRRGKICDLRGNLESVRNHGRWFEWEEKQKSVVWTSRSLVDNLCDSLVRRVMDSRKQETNRLALWGAATVRSEDIAAFLWAATNDEAIQENLWGLVLVDREKEWPVFQCVKPCVRPLPRSYALMKLLFISGRLKIGPSQEPVSIATDSEVLSRLRANDIAGAVRLALRRLRGSGFWPMLRDGERPDPGLDTKRLAASLIFPFGDPRQLARMIVRPIQAEEDNL